MGVNYMLEIIGLDDWELTHPLPATAYKLMRKLQYLANKERFPERMNVSNGLLMSMIGCSEDSLIKARNQLIQAGLIQYKGQKKITPLYMIQYFSDNPAYNSKKTGYEQGIKQGYEQGISAGNEHGTYINKTTHSETRIFDDEDVEDDLAYARARMRVEAAFKQHFGRCANEAEASRLGLVFREQPEFLIRRCIQAAAENGAKNPLKYIICVFHDWEHEYFQSESEIDEYIYLNDSINRGDIDDQCGYLLPRSVAIDRRYEAHAERVKRHNEQRQTTEG